MKKPGLTTDAVIINDKNEVFLMKRAIDPFKGTWVLPGGHVEYKEEVEDALKREIKEEIGANLKIENLFGVYSAPNRDPRDHIVTIVYTGKIDDNEEIKLGEEASTYKFFSLSELPENIGFDHKKIIEDLKNR